MTILIKGMEMPKFGALNIFVLPDGKVLGEVSGQAPLRLNILGTAVPVPTPHGRLINADELITTFCEWGTRLERGRKLVITMCEAKQAIVNIIADAPTVIEAEEKQ